MDGPALLINPVTGEQLWGDRYERDLRDVLALQNEILGSIAGQIKVKLTRQDAARLASARPVNPEAYELCLKGRFYIEKLSRESLDIPQEYYQRALEKERDYALAHAGIGSTLLARAHMGFVPFAAAMAAGKAAVLKAIELDDTLADLHLQLAANAYYGEWDWSGAEQGTLKIGTIAGAQLEPYIWATGKPTALYDTIFTTISGSPAFVGKASKFRVDLPDCKIELRDHNAISGSFRFEA